MKFTRDRDKDKKPAPRPPTVGRSSQMLRPTAPKSEPPKAPKSPPKSATPAPKPPPPQPKAAPKPPPAPRQKVTARPAPPPSTNPSLDTPLGKAMAEAVKGFDPDAKDYIAVRHAGVAAKLADGYSRVGEVKDSTSDQQGTLVVMEKAR